MPLKSALNTKNKTYSPRSSLWPLGNILFKVLYRIAIPTESISKRYIYNGWYFPVKFRIQNPVKLTRWSFWYKSLSLSPKKLHLWSLTGFWIQTISQSFFQAVLKQGRSNCSQLFLKIGVLKNFAIFTGKHLCSSLILINLQARRSATLLKRHSKTGDFLWISRNF